MDLRDRHPEHTPTHGWHVSRPRHPDGWLAMWIDYVNREGRASYDSESGVLTIERLAGESLPQPWLIEVTEAVLEAHLASLLDEDGTVYGLDDPDEPVETDSMIAAWSLFMVHVDEQSSGDGPVEFHHVLVPDSGLRPR